MRLYDLSAVAFNRSATALSVTLSPETVGILSALLSVAIESRFLWASDGEPLSQSEHESLTDALDLAWEELRTDDDNP